MVTNVIVRIWRKLYEKPVTSTGNVATEPMLLFRWGQVVKTSCCFTYKQVEGEPQNDNKDGHVIADIAEY